MTDSNETTQSKPLDVLVDRALEVRREYRAEVPYVSTTSMTPVEAEPHERSSDVLTGRIRALVPTDQGTLLALAADPRVWAHEPEAMLHSIEDAIGRTVLEMLYETVEAADREAVSAV